MTLNLMTSVTILLSFGRCHEFSLFMLGAKSTPNAFFIFMRFLEWSSISTWWSSYSFTISQPYGESDYQHVEPLPSIQFPSQKLCFLSTLSLINIFNKEKKPLQICRHGQALTVILNIKLHEHIYEHEHVYDKKLRGSNHNLLEFQSIKLLTLREKLMR